MQDIKQPKQICLLSTSNIKHVIDEHNYNKHVRYKHKWVKREREREMSNCKHERIVSRFDPLALRPHLHCNEEFPLKMIPQYHSVPKHLQRAPSRALGPASPSLVSVRTTQGNPQARRGRNLYNSSIQGVEHLWSLLLITNKLSKTRIPIGWI